MAKMGRPVIGEPRTRAIGLRLKESDYQRLIKYAETHNLTITEAVEKSLRFLDSGEELMKQQEQV